MELEAGSAAGLQGRWESGPGWSGTHTAVLPMTSWGQIVSSFPSFLQSGLFYFSLQMGSPQCLRVCVLSSSDCLAVNSDESQSQIPSWGECDYFLLGLDISESVQLWSKQQSCIILTWSLESPEAHPEASASLDAGGGGAAGELLGVNPGCGRASFSFLSRENRVVWYFSAESTAFQKSLGLCALYW